MTLEVDVDDQVPFLFGHVEAHLVPQDPGVVDEHVEPAELVDRLRDQRLTAVPARDVVEVRGRLPAGGDDLVDHLLGRTLVGALAARLAAEIVDDDRGALGGEEQRLRPPDPATRTRDDRDLAVELTHWTPLVPNLT